jgi:phosphoserine phosphatase
MVKKFDTIIFDLDSTLVNIEGLEWLAHPDKIFNLPLISAAHEGKVPLNTAYEREVSIIAPSYADMLTLGRKYQQSLVEDAKEIIDALQILGKDVWLITNNFHPAIDIIANALNIPLENVFGNHFYFTNKGEYHGFDYTSLLTRNKGKAEIIKHHIDSNRKVAFIGDSVMDLEAKPVVDLFVGYGGVVSRKAVRDGSHIFLQSPSLTPLLQILLDKDEMITLEHHHDAELVRKAKAHKNQVS